MELDSSELLKRFVAAGVGIGFIARSSVDEDARANTWWVFPYRTPRCAGSGMVFRKDKALSRSRLLS